MTPPAPPRDLEAEVAVLGSILLDADAIGKVADWLSPDDFYRENNAQIYRAALNLLRAATPIDNVTLGAELERLRVLEQIGGRAHLAWLPEQVAAAANIEHHARIVKNLSERRRAIAAAMTHLERLQDLAIELPSPNGAGADDEHPAPPRAGMPFPLDVFPPAVAAYAERLSSAGLRDFVGASFLAAAAAAIGGGSLLRLGPTWVVRAILWLLLVGMPGDGKSEPMTDAASPLIEHHDRVDAIYDRELAEYEAGQRPAAPIHRGFMLDDITIEGLREQLRKDPACFALADEAHGFLKSLGQYKRTGGGDRDRWLTLWEGGTWRTRRVGGGVVAVQRPTLTLLGAIQPTRLSVLGAGDDGARARFLMARAGPPTGPRPHPTDEELAAYRGVLDRLVKVRHTPREWSLDTDARVRLTEVEARLRELARSGDEPDHVLELARKGNKWLARILLVLAELWRAHAAPGLVSADGLVESATVDLAEEVLDHYVDQRRRLDFPRPDLTAPLGVRDLDVGVRELRETLRSHPVGRLSRRQVIRGGFGGCRAQEGADRLLDRFGSVYPGTVRQERPAKDRGPTTRVVYDPDRRPANAI